MTNPKMYEVLAQAFIEEGVEVVFGLMGDANMLWMTHMAQWDSVRLIHARHENAAVAMADGYAQASGNVGICSVTCGPGFTQIATSLTSSVRHGTPLVVFAGDTPRGSSFHVQEFDPRLLVLSTGASHIALQTKETALEGIRRAFYIARHHNRPVVITVPSDLQEQSYPGDWSYQPSLDLLVTAQRSHPDPEVVRVAAQALGGSERPVFLCGRGAVQAGAKGTIVDLAEQVGALLSTTLRAKGWFDGRPDDVGVVGAFAGTSARKIMAAADLVVAFGARLGHYTTQGGSLFSAADVIQVDVAPGGLSEGVPVAQLHVRGDARVVAQAIGDALERRSPSSRGWRREDARALLTEDKIRERPIETEAGTVDPRWAMERIDEVIPTDSIVVVGIGHFWNFAIRYLRDRPPESYIFTGIDFGVIGQGLPAAIGAAVARPDCRVALIEGDGSLLMNMQELETVARHHIPLNMYILNDGAYGAEVHKLEARGISGQEAVFGPPDLASVAIALGVTAVRIRSQADDIPTDGESVEPPKAMLVDIHVSPTVRSAQYRRALFGEEV